MKQLLLVMVLASLLQAKTTPHEEKSYYGLADASAAVFLDENHFVVADDESNILRTYRVDETKRAVLSLDLNNFLEVDAASPEVDIEAAAKIDNRIYWISSHGRNKSGDLCKSRYRFFCTEIKESGDSSNPPLLVPVGKPCKDLIEQLSQYPSPVRQLLEDRLKLDSSLSKKERQRLAPKKLGVNIEAMTHYRVHDSLLIGLRNPLNPSIKGKNAIVLELRNFREVIEDGSEANFGNVLSWNLKGRGIRAMHYHHADQMYYIVAGAISSKANFAIYQWDGNTSSQPKIKYEWKNRESDFKPEGISSYESTSKLWLFSDDGTLKVKTASGEKTNKRLPYWQRSFRVRTIRP